MISAGETNLGLGLSPSAPGAFSMFLYSPLLSNGKSQKETVNYYDTKEVIKRVH
jgi:hypothetical protein